MIGIFKQKSSGNAFILLLYALILKFPLFLHPVAFLESKDSNYIYQILSVFLAPIAAHAPVALSVVAFLLYFTQATLLNRIANSLKLLPRANFLVGMSYLLVSSLIKDWAAFSAPLIINSLMIWILYRMIGLYNHSNPKTAVYNVALMLGILPLIYTPAAIFVLLLAVALIITRPPKITEWLVALLGLLTPYYFLFVYLFMNDRWRSNIFIPSIHFHRPQVGSAVWLIVGLVLLAVPFLTGGYFVQSNLNKMLIQVRKAWGLLLFFLICFFLLLVIYPANNYLHWMLMIIPVAAFHAAAYFYIPAKWVASFLQWICFVFAVLLNYGLLK